MKGFDSGIAERGGGDSGGTTTSAVESTCIIRNLITKKEGEMGSVSNARVIVARKLYSQLADGNPSKVT